MKTPNSMVPIPQSGPRTVAGHPVKGKILPSPIGTGQKHPSAVGGTEPLGVTVRYSGRVPYTQPPRPLNHAELVHRPGERELTRRALAALGCEVRDGVTGVWIFADEVFLVSEVTPEQWAFEEWLSGRIGDEPDGPYKEFVDQLAVQPQRYPHLGIGFETLSAWEDTVERIRTLPATDPALAQRLEVASVFRPGDPGSFGDDFVQAFVRTDIFSVGLLTLGQTLELQHYYANDPQTA